MIQFSFFTVLIVTFVFFYDDDCLYTCIYTLQKGDFESKKKRRRLEGTRKAHAAAAGRIQKKIESFYIHRALCVDL